MAWIGKPGQLIRFKCPSAADVTPADPRRFFTSDTGAVAVTHPLRGVNARVWEVSVDTARPADVATLTALSLGDFGVGPFYWIPPGAESTNLLSQHDSLLRGRFTQRPGVTEAGSLETSEGWAGRSLAPGGSGAVLLGVTPVLPGTPVTARAWVSGGTGVVLKLTFQDHTGALLSEVSAPAVNATAGAWVHLTAPAPVGAARAEIEVTGATAVTRPSATWTTEPRTWIPGAASLAVSIQPIPTTLLRATGLAGEETLSQHRFTVQEII